MLSNEQEITVKKFQEGKNIFISGPGGCGKSFIIKHLCSLNSGKNISVCAMTGCAAILLEKAKTLHSFAGINLAKGSNSDIIEKIKKKRNIVRNWKTVDCLIIDEVSMLSKQILELLNDLAKTIRKNNKIMGGIQVIFSGDFYQLPPVSGDPFCFESDLWNEIFTPDCHIIYDKIFRQNDTTFQNILNQIRVGKLNENNKKILQNLSQKPNLKGVELYPIKALVNNINKIQYSKLDNNEYSFSIIKNINCSEKIKSFELENEINNLIRSSGWEETIYFKQGSIVMCTSNIDITKGICNGSQGEILNFYNGLPCVKFYNGQIRVINRQIIKSDIYDDVSISQIPLILSWATTIHKIQGSTLENAIIDIGNNIFTYGQTYVALSRLKSFDGLSIKNFSPEKIKVNPIVSKFYQKLKK